MAAELEAGCRLLKDVPGVYNTDPASSTAAHRFLVALVGDGGRGRGAVHTAEGAALRTPPRPALRGRAAERAPAGTRVGTRYDEWATPSADRRAKAVGVALLGVGVVGRGVYETLKRYRGRFEIRHVVVREPARYLDVEHRTIDPSVVLSDSVEVVVVCFGGVDLAYPLIAAALNAGKFVVTANKAAVAASGIQDGSVEAAILQIDAAGSALNLQAANRIIMLEPSWTPGANTQAVARAVRIGQQNPVLVSWPVIRRSIDERVMQVLRRKQDGIADLWRAAS